MTRIVENDDFKDEFDPAVYSDEISDEDDPFLKQDSQVDINNNLNDSCQKLRGLSVADEIDLTASTLEKLEQFRALVEQIKNITNYFDI